MDTKHSLQKFLHTFWDDSLAPFEERSLSSPISLSEDDKSVYVEAALPGLSDQEIDVTLDKKVLWIRGNKKEAQDNKKYHYRAKRSYSYQIALPESIDDTKDPETKYQNGVLNIVFPKIKGETARKISVRT